jgi:anthranilate synthase/aminodeoxychorismate synthase-like glutamine amidotransferase
VVRILLLDNYDSFTWNLAALLELQGARVTVVRNDAADLGQLIDLAPQGLVISPGPGRPTDSGICAQAVHHFAGQMPIWGVCLGHQLLAERYGARIETAQETLHGKTRSIRHTAQGLFVGLPDSLQVMRYHSLAIVPHTLPNDWMLDALTDDGEIMAIRHPDLQLYGVQFHPESILTECGHEIARNFISICEKTAQVCDFI